MPGESRHVAAARRRLATVLAVAALGWPFVANGEVKPGDVITKTLEGWVAGRPFPHIDKNDPQVADKIMHNFEKTHYFTDLALHLFDADTGQLSVDAEGNQQHYNIERHFVEKYGGEESWFSIAALIEAGR